MIRDHWSMQTVLDRRTPGRVAYATLSVPLAAVYAAVYVCLVSSVTTVFQGIGLLVLPVVLASVRGLGGFEQIQARVMLGLRLEAGVRQRRQPGAMLQRLRRLLAATTTWRTMAWLGVRLLLGLVVLATIAAAVWAGTFVGGYPRWSPWPSRAPWLDVLVAALLVLLAVLVIVALDRQVRIAAAIAPRLLGAGPEDEVAVLRRFSQRLVERNRLARDLHDSIGHALTASLLQASAARRTLGADPAAVPDPADLAFARQALEHVEANTRGALGELDRALALLRDGAVLGPTANRSSHAEMVAEPDLSDLDGLLAGLRDGGLPVTLTADPVLQHLPPEVSRLCYRVVQEGTTNVLRHAGCVPTTVRVVCRHHEVAVEVRNVNPPPAGIARSPGGGSGVEGLRERVAALGGDLTANRTPDGQFALAVRVPLGTDA